MMMMMMIMIIYKSLISLKIILFEKLPLFCKFDIWFAPWKGIQDSPGFWIPCRKFQIPGTWLHTFSVELGFWIPILCRIPDPLSCIPYSKAQDSGFHKQNFPGFRIRNPDYLIWGDLIKHNPLLILCSRAGHVGLLTYYFKDSFEYLFCLLSFFPYP